MSKTFRITEGERRFGGRHNRNRQRRREEVNMDKEDYTTFIEADRLTRTMFPMF